MYKVRSGGAGAVGGMGEHEELVQVLMGLILSGCCQASR
jgi:hypothetical protein